MSGHIRTKDGALIPFEKLLTDNIDNQTMYVVETKTETFMVPFSSVQWIRNEKKETEKNEKLEVI